MTLSIAVAERVLPSWARAARLTCVRTAGDSLEPADGALVVVDKDRRVAVDEQLFVVRVGEALVVKRFRQVCGQWSLVSDSLAHLPRPMTADDRNPPPAAMSNLLKLLWDAYRHGPVPDQPGASFRLLHPG